jgi:hypothetical protein
MIIFWQRELADAGLIERLGTKKEKGMKRTKGNGINGLEGRLCGFMP